MSAITGLVAATLALSPPTAPAPREPSVRALVGRARPTIDEIQEAALRRAAVDPRITRRWLARARSAAILPTVQGALDSKRDLGWSLDQEAGAADQLQQDAGAGRSLQLRVTWELDRLIFDPNELRAARAAIDVAQIREQVLVRVTQLYFERLQLLLQLADASASEGRSIELRVLEIEAVLTGITGLRFDPQGPAGGR